MFMIYSAPLGSFKTFSEYILYSFTWTVYFKNGVQNVHVIDSLASLKSTESSRRDENSEERPILSRNDLCFRFFIRENKINLVNIISEPFLLFGLL